MEVPLWGPGHIPAEGPGTKSPKDEAKCEVNAGNF